jgi:tRNA wybutosine-synthesizing protein 4
MDLPILTSVQVMANVLCQIKGSKRLLLFPPSDIQHLRFEPGASSSGINVFKDFPRFVPPNSHPHEVLLNPGDVLFLPPLWLHTASPTSGISIAVNVFFRNLQAGYAAGKDIYGNRDLQAYEKGRQDITKIIKSFDSLPLDVRGFYLQRLCQEFQEKAS